MLLTLDALIMGQWAYFVGGISLDRSRRNLMGLLAAAEVRVNGFNPLVVALPQACYNARRSDIWWILRKGQVQ